MKLKLNIHEWVALETRREGKWGVFTEQGHYGVFDATAPGIDSEANARLCAAAPELLEALLGVLDIVGHYAEQPSDKPFDALVWIEMDGKMSAARAAIAKAKPLANNG